MKHITKTPGQVAAEHPVFTTLLVFTICFQLGWIAFALLH